MSDTYKLQYNGMTLAYPGWGGYVGWENAEVAYNLYLQQQTGGTIIADKLSGINGEIVTLGNTPDAGYQFNSYGITGAELTGNQFAFCGSNVTAAGTFQEAVYTLTLQNDGHGTIAATKTTGHAGDTVTLSNTYNKYYRFNNYTQTGGSLNGSTFTFGSQDATAKANFKVNYFTATGGFEKGSNVIATRGTTNKDTTTNIAAKYAVHGAHTGAIPTSWYSTSNRWKPNNVSAYKITLNPKMNITTKYPSNSYQNNSYYTCITSVSLVGSTQSNSQSWTAYIKDNKNTVVNHNYSKSFTSTTQNVNYGLSAKILIHNIESYPVTATYVANATTGTWTATGIAP